MSTNEYDYNTLNMFGNVICKAWLLVFHSLGKSGEKYISYASFFVCEITNEIGFSIGSS